MSKVVKRLLTFGIGLPLVICIVWIDFLYHLPLQITCFVISVLAANEFYNMLKLKHELFPRWSILLLDGLVFISEYIFILFGYNAELNIWVYSICVLVFMASSVFKNDFENSISKIALSSFIPLYSGFLLSFLPSLSVSPNSRYLIILFLVIVFMCDSSAWFFGILFGKNNRGLFPASPNKSIIGFVGGLAGAVFFGCLVNFLFRNVITVPYWKICVVSFFTGLAGIIGDLIESVFKRDCGVKDSGKIIPGRGGLMDCADSVSAAAPLYYILVYFLLKL